jgi:hypothetical protein
VGEASIATRSSSAVAFSGLGCNSIVRNNHVKAYLCQVVQVLNGAISEILFGNRYTNNVSIRTPA